MSELNNQMVEVKVTGIAMAGTPQGPVPVAVLEDPRERVLLLVMDGAQALAIQCTLDGETVQSTHGFMLEVLKSLKASFKEAVLYDVKESRFLSKAVLETKSGVMEIDGRAGDVVTLAILAKAPIMVSDKVMNKASLSKEELYKASEQGEAAQEGEAAK
ncbi:MAG: DUF151 domain-containing protein [Candidatus Nezhaarchaeota archaeon]|nr:DUF151 domain-containing protein [Candidatus Nezhaarchaeota archaeon]